VPAGNVAFVVYANECPERTLPREVQITDSSGTALGIELEASEDDRGELLVRTEPPLVPGTYQVVTPDGRSQSLTVTEPAALPTALGELTLKSQSNCRRVFDLALDEGALAYASLLGTEVHVTRPGQPLAADARDPSVVSPGWLAVKDGHAALNISPSSRKPGQYTVELRPRIAGYDTEMLPAVATMDWSCAVE
jgi:hypothetical protein